MTEQEDKYANIDVIKVYEYIDLPDKIAGRCDNCGSVKCKNAIRF